MKTLILVLGFFYPLFSNAQIPNIRKGEVFEHSKKLHYSHAVESAVNAQYFFESSGPMLSGTCLLYKIRLDDGKLAFKNEVVFEEKMDFVAAYNKNDKILLFTKRKDYKAQIFYLLLREFDNKTGAEIGQTKIVNQLSLTDGSSIERDFFITFSPDDRKMLVVSELRGKKTAPEVTAKLFDTQSSKNIWEKKAITVFENSPVYTFNYAVDNSGVFSYLFAFYRSNSPTDIAYGIGLVPINNFQNQMIKIPSAGRTIYNPYLEYVANNLICSGEFFEGEDQTKKTKEVKGMGFFFVSVDLNTAEIKTQSFDLLNEELKTKLSYKDKSPYYGVTGVNSFSYAHKNYRHYQTLLINDNFYLIKHHSYILIINGVPTTSNKEILVMKYNKDKKLEWVRMIPRSSYSMGAISSQLNLVYTKKLNFFYYEHPKNQAIAIKDYNGEKYKMQVGPTEKTLIVTSINDSGDMQKQSVLTENTFYLSEEFEKNFDKSENRILGRGETESKKTRRYDVITLND